MSDVLGCQVRPRGLRFQPVWLGVAIPVVIVVTYAYLRSGTTGQLLLALIVAVNVATLGGHAAWARQTRLVAVADTLILRGWGPDRLVAKSGGQAVVLRVESETWVVFLNAAEQATYVARSWAWRPDEVIQLCRGLDILVQGRADARVTPKQVKRLYPKADRTPTYEQIYGAIIIVAGIAAIIAVIELTSPS